MAHGCLTGPQQLAAAWPWHASLPCREAQIGIPPQNAFVSSLEAVGSQFIQLCGARFDSSPLCSTTRSCLNYLPTHQPTPPSQTFRDDDETPTGVAAAQAASTGPRPDNFHCANWTPSARTSWPRASTMLNVFRVLGMTTFFGAGRGVGGRGGLARKRERARTRTRTGLGRAWGRGRLTRHRCDRGFFPSSVHLHSASQDSPAEGAFGLFF